jgi:actin-related protein
MDIRSKLARNVFITGGTTNMIGFKLRLMHDLRHFASSNTRYNYLQELINTVRFVQSPLLAGEAGSPAQGLIATWTGGVFFGLMK